MQLTGSQDIEAPRERVWDGLLDPRFLKAAIPGCESFTLDDDGAYSAVVLASLGPVRARFRGRLWQEDLHPPARCTLRFEGEGGIAGFAKGSAQVVLEDIDGDTARTRLSYSADVAMGGRLAQIGSRLIDATAKRMAGQFFDKFEALLKDPSALAEGSGEAAAPAASGGQEAFGSDREPAAAVPGKAALVAAAPAVSPAGQFTLQMPGWAWAFTVAVLAAAAAWLGTH
ncbi:CoxG family protein [Nitratireductor alexandrii]|uniref:CoxG family protein n=1 Tax=Nitratireductor alexandrii TaxID=2448161 RepID=UPI000FD80A66|nr:carbon monoxide dehydrogenase subunit G [Nitratireductor alexandrii]